MPPPSVQVVRGLIVRVSFVFVVVVHIPRSLWATSVPLSSFVDVSIYLENRILIWVDPVIDDPDNGVTVVVGVPVMPPTSTAAPHESRKSREMLNRIEIAVNIILRKRFIVHLAGELIGKNRKRFYWYNT